MKKTYREPSDILLRSWSPRQQEAVGPHPPGDLESLGGLQVDDLLGHPVLRPLEVGLAVADLAVPLHEGHGHGLLGGGVLLALFVAGREFLLK